MENKKILRYAAGACFALIAILFITRGFTVRSFQWEMVTFGDVNIVVWKVLAFVGAGMIAASFYVSLPYLSTVGSALCGLTSLRILAFYLKRYGFDSFVIKLSAGKMVMFVLYVAIWVLLAIAGVNKSMAKYMGFAAGAAALLYTILLKLNDGGFYLREFLDVIAPILLIAGCVLFALSPPEGIQKAKPIPASARSAAPAGGALSQTERLLKLKSLLDSGVITQEEFDAKKKDIMG